MNRLLRSISRWVSKLKFHSWSLWQFCVILNWTWTRYCQRNYSKNHSVTQRVKRKTPTILPCLFQSQDTWTVGYDKVFIYDKWLERGKKVRRYHRALFFNLFSRGQTALPGYKQIGIFGNIKYTHDQKYERTWLSHWLEYLQ